MNLENTTPFAAEAYGLDDGKGRNMVLIIVKATYIFTKEGVISLASKQAPIELADEFYGKPGESSIKYASDFCFDIPATDIAMIGHIQAPDPDCTTLMVTLRVGTKEKTIQLFGKRHWRNGMGIHLPSAPEPFEKIPLMYEYAYGGTDTSHDDPKKHDCEQRNPLGVGFRAKKSKLPIKGTALPHIEDPAALIKISRFIIDIDKEIFYIVWTGNTRIDEEFSAIEKISCFLKEEKQKSE